MKIFPSYYFICHFYQTIKILINSDNYYFMVSIFFKIEFNFLFKSSGHDVEWNNMISGTFSNSVTEFETEKERNAVIFKFTNIKLFCHCFCELTRNHLIKSMSIVHYIITMQGLDVCLVVQLCEIP